MEPTAQIFGDITVVELGQYIAAPYCAELLAHGGADVISIEPVDGGPTRHNSQVGTTGEGRQYVVKARGKRALPIRLSTEEGTRIVRDLIRGADVLITNMRPGQATTLGLGWEQLHAEQPDLIFAEVNGFGDKGPLAEEACVDIVAQAASGLMRSLGARDEGRSSPSDVMIADYTAGTMLAFGVAAALRHRERTGEGQRVATSLMGACLTAQHRRANRFDDWDTWQYELADRLAPGDGPGPGVDIEAVAVWRNEQIGIPPYFYNCFAVADGEVAVGAVAVNGPRLLTVAGLDPADLDGPARLRGLTVGETTDLVAAHLAGRGADELVAELRSVGVPAAKVVFLEEALADPDLAAAGLLHQFDHARIGPTTMPAPPLSFSSTTYEPANTTPAFGEHTDSLLRGLGYDDAVIDQLVADGIVSRAVRTTT